MGESRRDALRVNFDKKLKLEFHGTKVTSDAGLLAYRELDEALGQTNNRVRLMPRIVEKLEFMKVRAVKVCAKAGIGRNAGHKKPCFPANFQ